MDKDAGHNSNTDKPEIVNQLIDNFVLDKSLRKASEEIADKLGCRLYIYSHLGHAAYEEAKDFNRRVYDFLMESKEQANHHSKECLVMKKAIKNLYYVSLVFSMLVGLWHFFVPHMFHWYDYLPMQYKTLIVGIDYTNYCFPLCCLAAVLFL